MTALVEIFPEKHVRVTESLLGIGTLILVLLKGGARNIDSIWSALSFEETIRDRINGAVTFDLVILAVDALFAIGLVELDDEGRLALCG